MDIEKVNAKLFGKIETFLSTTSKNLWIYEEGIKLYIRKSYRVFEGKMYYCLDLASIEIEEQFQNKGIFTNFFFGLTKKFPNLNLFVESVLTQRFRKKLLDLGFTKKENNNPFEDHFQHDFFKLGNQK